MSKPASKPTSGPTQFRILAGSYEHNLLCLSLMLRDRVEPVFQPIFHFQAHTRSIKTIDVARRYLVTGSNDEHIRIYDLKKRKELGTLLSHQGTVTSLKFSRDVNEDGPGKRTEKNGRWLLSGSEDGKINIWRTKDWELFGTLKGHQGRVNDLDIHPTGRLAISVGSDKTIRLWNMMTAKKAASLKIKGKDHLGQSGELVRWTPDGKHFLVALLNQLFVYELAEEAKLIRKLKFQSTLMCLEVVAIEDKAYFAVGLNNGSIEFYDAATCIKAEEEEKEEKEEKEEEAGEKEKDNVVKPAFTLQGHSNRIKGMSFICNEEDTHNVPYLVSVSSDGKIVVWNVSSSCKDQVAVYDTGERLNCVTVCGELIESPESLKRSHESAEMPSETEYETDTDAVELRKAILGSKKQKKGKKAVTVTLE